jgi:hypothetical protein
MLYKCQYVCLDIIDCYVSLTIYSHSPLEHERRLIYCMNECTIVYKAQKQLTELCGRIVEPI